MPALTLSIEKTMIDNVTSDLKSGSMRFFFRKVPHGFSGFGSVQHRWSTYTWNYLNLEP